MKVTLNESPEEFDLNAPLALHRIYIKASFRNSGLGSRLINEAIRIAGENHCHTIWLGVWNENYKAIRFYERIGFRKFGNYRFVMGTIISDDYLYKLEL